MKNEILNNKVEGLYYFGEDDNGNKLQTVSGNFDYILAEYDKNRDFIKNIPCRQNQIKELI